MPDALFVDIIAIPWCRPGVAGQFGHRLQLAGRPDHGQDAKTLPKTPANPSEGESAQKKLAVAPQCFRWLVRPKRHR